MRTAARALALLLTLLTIVTLAAACLEDEAAVTTPSSLAKETPTRSATKKPSPTGTAVETATVSEAVQKMLDELMVELVAQACGTECDEGVGQLEPAVLQAQVTDLVVPPVLPADIPLQGAFLWPSEAGAEANSIADATVSLIYISEDGESWIELFEGPDTRTAPATGEDLDLDGGITAVLTLDETDDTKGALEWVNVDGVLFQLAWQGLSQEDVVAFAEATVD